MYSREWWDSFVVHLKILLGGLACRRRRELVSCRAEHVVRLHHASIHVRLPLLPLVPLVPDYRLIYTFTYRRYANDHTGIRFAMSSPHRRHRGTIRCPVSILGLDSSVNGKQWPIFIGCWLALCTCSDMFDLLASHTRPTQAQECCSASTRDKLPMQSISTLLDLSTIRLASEVCVKWCHQVEPLFWL